MEKLWRGRDEENKWPELLWAAFWKAGDELFDSFMHDREVEYRGSVLALNDRDLEALRWLALEGFELLAKGRAGRPATSPLPLADDTFYRALSLAGIADHDVRNAYHSLYFAPLVGALAAFTSSRAAGVSYASSPFSHHVPAPDQPTTSHP